MKKFLSAVAVMFVAVVGVQAAPALGVDWRAPVNAKIPGVRIISVDAGGNAEELGLQPGDIVLAINNKLVKTGAEATAAVKAANGKLSMLVMDVNSGGLVMITADIDEPTKGLTAGQPVKTGYSNIVRKKKK